MNRVEMPTVDQFHHELIRIHETQGMPGGKKRLKKIN